MTDSEFRLFFDDQVVKCSKTLCSKRKEYTGDHQDRLIAFKVVASLQGCTPQRALVGMMAKHIVSLYDMCYAKPGICFVDPPHFSGYLSGPTPRKIIL